MVIEDLAHDSGIVQSQLFNPQGSDDRNIIGQTYRSAQGYLPIHFLQIQGNAFRWEPCRETGTRAGSKRANPEDWMAAIRRGQTIADGNGTRCFSG
jgi:hypothetical protein